MAINNKTQAREQKRVTVSYSDSIDLVKDQVHWTPKGVSLLTKWPFRVGAEVEFAFDHNAERHCCTGVVVACHPLRRPLGFYEIILYFVETPCSELQKAACDCRLAQEQEGKAGIRELADEEKAADGDGSMNRVRSSRARR